MKAIVFRYKSPIGEEVSVKYYDGVFTTTKHNLFDVESTAMKIQTGGYPTTWGFINEVSNRLGGKMLTPKPEEPAPVNPFLVH